MSTVAVFFQLFRPLTLKSSVVSFLLLTKLYQLFFFSKDRLWHHTTLHCLCCHHSGPSHHISEVDECKLSYHRWSVCPCLLSVHPQCNWHLTLLTHKLVVHLCSEHCHSFTFCWKKNVHCNGLQSYNISFLPTSIHPPSLLHLFHS